MGKKDHQGRCRGLWLVLLFICGPAWGQNKYVTVDDQPTAEQRIEEINAMCKSGRHDAAAELVQELIEQSRHKLVGLGQGRYTDAGTWCYERLIRDAELCEAYRSRYTATASRAFETALQSEEPIRQLAQVYYRYPATEPALKAGMQLAGRLLEAGEVGAADKLIEELLRHPDQGAVLKQLIALQGAVAVYQGEKKGVADSLERLGELSAHVQKDWLNELSASTTSWLGLDQAAAKDTAKKPEEFKKPLWEQPLAVNSTEQASRWMRYINPVPVVTPNYALINNGRQVVALDRASGQEAWTYPAEPLSTADDLSGRTWLDQRSVAVDRDKFYAVIGESVAVADGQNQSVTANQLTCIDAVTGMAIWSRSAGQIDEDEPTIELDRRAGRVNLQNTHFLGTPIVSQGRVFTLLRRASQGSLSVWLLAYDANDGSMIWFRHLSLVTLTYATSDAARTRPQLTLHGNTLYLTDSIATVAAIDTHSGSYRWLNVLPVGDERSESFSIRSDGVNSPPVVTRSGLLIHLSNTKDRMLLLDPEDGKLLRGFKDDPQAQNTRYVQESPGGSLVVSEASVMQWDADLASYAWVFRLDEDEKTIGLGDVTANYAIVPTSRRTLVLDLATGELLDEGNTVNGSVVVCDGEVFTVNSGFMQAYTTWDRANQRLLKRIQDLPEDPAAGLALAGLALRQGGLDDAVMLGVGHALEALNLQPPDSAERSRKHVFEQLRKLAAHADASTLRAQLYDKLALTTQTAEQEAAYHLEVGRFLAQQGQPYRAIDHFHAVIAEPAFSSQPYTDAGSTYSAGVIAYQEIQSLIGRYGQGVYARYDAMARAWMLELKAVDALDAAAVTMLARRYPLSVVAVEALISAGLDRQREGRQLDALVMFQQAVVLANERDQKQFAVGTLLSYYLANNRADDARELLHRHTTQNPGLDPLDGDKPLAIQAWRSRIDLAEQQNPDQPRLSEKLGKPIDLDGRLITLAPGISPKQNSDLLFLLHKDFTLSCFRANQPRQPVWSMSPPGGKGGIYLLESTDQQLLFWAYDTGVVFATDPATGELRWQNTLSFEDEGASKAMIRTDTPLADTPRVLVRISDSVLCFVRTDISAVVALERVGGTVLWKTKLDMAKVSAIDADNWTLAVAGFGAELSQTGEGRLALLSLFTGKPSGDKAVQPVSQFVESMLLNQSRLFMSGARGVVGADPITGQALWTQRLSGSTPSGQISVSGSLLAVADISDNLYLLDADQQGKVLDRFYMRGPRNRSDIVMQALNEHVWVRSELGLFCLGMSPTLVWRDAIGEAGVTSGGMIVGHENVALFATSQEAEDVAGQVMLFIFDREGGRLKERYLFDETAQQLEIDRSILFGGGLVIPAGDRAMFLPPDGEQGE